VIYRVNVSRVRTDEARIEIEAETPEEAKRLAKETAEAHEAFFVPLSVEFAAEVSE
jgi:hypothetical protein